MEGPRTVALHGLVLSVLLSGVVAVIPNGGNDVISCLQGRIRCHDNTTCANLFDDMEDYCDESLDRCQTLHPDECRRVLLALQNNPYLGTCVCDRDELEIVDCQRVQSRIFLHACVRKDGGGGSGQLWTRDDSLPRGISSPEELEALEDEVDKEPTCIGVRKLCLNNLHCHEAFDAFQRTCSMRKNVCSSTDRNACFQAIETIKPTELFDCTCKDNMKPFALEKCKRIKHRLSQNPCLVTIPYFVYSAAPQEKTYKDLVYAITSTGEQHKEDIESTCSQAFLACNEDPTCRVRLAETVITCTWDAEMHTCDRVGCLEAIRTFYLLGRPERTHSLLFCKCSEDAADDNCASVRAALFPTCSLIQDPPPSCLEILESCSLDDDCRTRWQAYRQYCRYDSEQGGCPAGTGRCRSAQAGTMGTILTTNCTCALSDPQEQDKCLDARNQLQNKNTCTEMSMDDFHNKQLTTPHTLSDSGQEEALKTVDIQVYSTLPGCIRELGYKIPPFMETPNVIRRYSEKNDCSEVCQCKENGTLICTRLPCGPNLSCKTRTNQIYANGKSFSHSERGDCRCVRGEKVCAKPEGSIIPKPGLFLHVGYSRRDLYLVEGSADLVFSPREVATKFAAMLNSDSAQQFCTLELYRHTDTNLLFEIKVATDSPLDKVKGCVTPASMLSSKINSRHSLIITDAELSIIKVAQVELVFYHSDSTDHTQQSLVGASSAAWRVTSQWTRVLVSLLLVLLAMDTSWDVQCSLGGKTMSHSRVFHRVKESARVQLLQRNISGPCKASSSQSTENLCEHILFNS